MNVLEYTKEESSEIKRLAKEVLSSYRRLSNIIGETGSTKSPEFSDMPKGVGIGNSNERIIIKALDVILERDKIDYAVSKMRKVYADIIRLTYMDKDELLADEVAYKLGYANGKTILNAKEKALFEFSECYDLGAIILKATENVAIKAIETEKVCFD